MSRFEQVINTLIEINKNDQQAIDHLEKLEMKSQFRAPEMQGQSWMDLAMFIKSTMTAEQLAIYLFNQSEAILFTDSEKTELQRALLKNRDNINKFIASDKTNDADEAVAETWLENNSSAYEKLQSDE
ncbi:hypothetical protein [Paenibacillus sp. 481]|uniref:hypothetical protein n=1 Tax=Paenibacillus sp. 481 TaxID=2835869 RepID=UPI001E2DAE18|nr:hypothetical protein [Paenibacillus sp. 481]UHA74444.1 hypothetical protein KIK04_04875 [Paenibacillus sp. 481]